MAAFSELARDVFSVVRRVEKDGELPLEAPSATPRPEVAYVSSSDADGAAGAQMNWIGDEGLETGNGTATLARLPDGWTQRKSAVWRGTLDFAEAQRFWSKEHDDENREGQCNGTGTPCTGGHPSHNGNTVECGPLRAIHPSCELCPGTQLGCVGIQDGGDQRRHFRAYKAWWSAEGRHLSRHTCWHVAELESMWLS